MLNTQKINKLNNPPNLTNITFKNNIEMAQPNVNANINSNPMVVNNFNIVGGEQNNSIIVEHDKNKNEFVFKNPNNQLIGGFNILQLFKFINNNEDTFLMDINICASTIF